MEASPQNPLLDEQQAAALMSVSPRTLTSWRKRGRGPVFMRIGSRIRYSPVAIEGWLRARRASVALSRKPKPVTLAHRPSLSPRMVELVALELSRGFAGEVSMSAATARRLSLALEPHEGVLAGALCREAAIRADGTIRLVVPRHISFTDAHLRPNQFTVTVEYSRRSGRWISDVAAGPAEFDRLCAHVWRLQGRREGMAARDLLAHIGAAYLALLAEGRGE